MAPYWDEVQERFRNPCLRLHVTKLLLLWLMILPLRQRAFVLPLTVNRLRHMDVGWNRTQQIVTSQLGHRYMRSTHLTLSKTALFLPPEGLE